MAIGAIALVKLLLLHLGTTGALLSLIRKPLQKGVAGPMLTLIALSLVLQAFSPNVWVLYAGLAALTIGAGRRGADTPGILFFLTLTLPEYHYSLAIGDTPLIALASPVIVALASLVPARGQLTRTGHFGRRFWILLLVATAFQLVVAVRGTAATNWVREVVHWGLALVLPVVALAYLFARSRSVRVFSVWVLATGVFLATSAIFESTSRWNVYRSFYQNVLGNLSWSSTVWRNGLVRAAGPMLEASTLGLLLCLFLLFTLSCKGVFAYRWARWPVAAWCVVGMYMPQSTNAAVGAAVGIAALFLFRSVPRLGMTAGALAIALAVATIAAVWNMPKSSPGLEESTFDYRVRLLDRGRQEYRKAPMLGETKAVVDRRMKDLRQGEHIIDYVNSYLYAALTGGVLGLAAMLLCLAYVPLSLSRRLPRHAFQDPLGGLAYLFASSVAMITMLFFTWGFGVILLVLLMMHAFGIPLSKRQLAKLPMPGPRKKRLPHDASRGDPAATDAGLPAGNALGVSG